MPGVQYDVMYSLEMLVLLFPAILQAVLSSREKLARRKLGELFL